jgi:catechol 2,3-dioxygenase-like lactoylglutathione lyase family enzyme
VNDLQASVEFYTSIMGFENVGTVGLFTVIRTGPCFQLQLAPWDTEGFERYVFVVSSAEFDSIFGRVKKMGRRVMRRPSTLTIPISISFTYFEYLP